MEAFFDGSTEQLRQFIPGLIANFTIKQALKGLLEKTAGTILPRFLGPELAQLISQSASSDDSDQAQAYALAQELVAKIGFADYLPFAEVQIGDDGITITAVADRRAAFDYQTQKIDRSLRESGWAGLDDLLKLIASKPNSFPGWEQAPYNLEYQDALFSSAVQFSKFYGIQDRWLTFWALRPFIQAIEDRQGGFQLSRIDALPGTVTEAQKAPLKRILLRALAYESVIAALPNLSVEINGVNVQLNYASQYGGNASYYTPPGKDMLDWVASNLRGQADVFWKSFESALSTLNPQPDSPDDGMGLIESDGPFQMI